MSNPLHFFSSSSNLKTEDNGPEVLNNKKPTFINIVGDMRPGMRLVVLDVDKTIYDRAPIYPEFEKRPYLYHFLREIYKHYDIAVWSDTNAGSLRIKLRKLNIMKESHFKISFFLDNKAVREVCNNSSTKIRTKPLSIIWEAFPQYGRHNTIICEDNGNYLFENPENGLLVNPYFFRNYYRDNELLLLKKYLIFLSTVGNFAEVDHTKWKTLIKNL